MLSIDHPARVHAGRPDDRRRPAGQRVPQAPSPRIAGNIARNIMARQASGAMSPRLVLVLFGWATSLALRLLGASWRVEVLGHDPRVPASPDAPTGPHLAALFHESLVVAAWLYRDQGYSAAVSRSRDGSLISSTLDWLAAASCSSKIQKRAKLNLSPYDDSPPNTAV